MSNPGRYQFLKHDRSGFLALISLSYKLTRSFRSRAIEKTAKSSHKYRQIAASIREIGLVEPPVRHQDTKDPSSYLLLDGHLRIEVLRDLGESEVECLVSTDDEAFTYNKRNQPPVPDPGTANDRQSDRAQRSPR